MAQWVISRGKDKPVEVQVDMSKNSIGLSMLSFAVQNEQDPLLTLSEQLHKSASGDV